MAAQCEVTAKVAAGAPLSLFERWLTLWVFLCILAGIAAGQLFPAPFQWLGRMEVAQVNLPVGLLIWVMIIPMLVKVVMGLSQNIERAAQLAALSTPTLGGQTGTPLTDIEVKEHRVRGLRLTGPSPIIRWKVSQRPRLPCGGPR